MYLLDTCTLLWLAGNAHERLSAKTVQILKRHGDFLFVSSISALEIGLKVGKGRLSLGIDPQTWFKRAVRAHGLHEIPVNGAIAAASTMLPPLHQDPCDRILISTALQCGLVILSPDEHLSRYPEVQTLW
ncbi:MAG: type II toxin-antitoxin system VapC family toxin [Acidobacteriota bacterium]